MEIYKIMYNYKLYACMLSKMKAYTVLFISMTTAAFKAFKRISLSEFRTKSITKAPHDQPYIRGAKEPQ